MFDNKSQPLVKQLWFKMLAGIILGVVSGLILSPHGLALFEKDVVDTLASWIALPGVVFMGLIKMVVIPLVFTSIVLAITSTNEISYLKTAGSRIGLYFVFTTCIAVTLGIVLANLFQPGTNIDISLIEGVKETAKTKISPIIVETRPSLPSLLSGLIPTNPAKAIIDRSMLQIVIGALLAGIAVMTLSKKQAKSFLDLCEAVQNISIEIVRWAMILAPFAVFGFLCTLTIKLGPQTLEGLLHYMFTVVTGLFCVLLFYLSLVKLVGKRSPIDFLKEIKDAQILAFSSSSSAATMPLTMVTATNRLNIRKEISEFVVPLGTTINMDGTALYQIIAAVFLTQVFGITLDPFELFILACTIVGASIGSPGSPGVGLVILATILNNIGIPAEGVALILAVDRILDMCRTCVNVTGDLTATIVLDKLVKK